MSSASDKAELFAENFSKNSNLDDSGISLLVFLFRTNLKQDNISVTLKMVKKVISNLGLSKTSGPDCIPVVVLKNCEPEPSYILAEVFGKCLKESCFPDCWRVSMHIPNRKNLYVNFSSRIFPGGKLGKIDENMKISKCCQSNCTSLFCFK